MKAFVISLSYLLCCVLAAAAQEQPQQPKQVRICIQYLSLPHAALTELLSGGPSEDASLHEQALGLAKEGRAKLLESSLIVCRSGEDAIVESVREEIYPTEYEPPQFPSNEREQSIRFPSFMPFTRAYAAFETRNVGVTLKVAPTVISPDLINLQLEPNLVHHLRLQTWMEHSDHWGKADVGFPIFETWATQTTIGLKPGTFTLVSVITPKRPLPVPFADSRVLLFVRADLVGPELDGEP